MESVGGSCLCLRREVSRECFSDVSRVWLVEDVGSVTGFLQ